MSTKLKAGTATSGAVIDADTTGILELQSGSTPTTAITVDASQNVGIGATPVAGYRLALQGSAAGVYLAATGGTAKTYAIGTNINTGTGELSFYDISSNAERMRIDTSGNLLVGTTSGLGGALFTVVGSLGAYLRSNGGAGNEPLNLHNTATSGTIYQITFRDGASATSRGSVTTNGTGTAYNTTSDYRLKENVAPMQNALNVVQQLKPVTYNWKVDGSSGQGFIAHELQEVVPDCVTGEKDAVDAEGNPQYQGIDTSFLVATLTAAIQEQQAMIEELKTKVAALEAK